MQERAYCYEILSVDQIFLYALSPAKCLFYLLQLMELFGHFRAPYSLTL